MSFFRITYLAIFSIVATVLLSSQALADIIYVPNDQGELVQPDLPTKTVLLTFDDGPSPYTPKILDILHEHHVPATFFVIGNQAAGHPLLKRMYNEGHDIANHSYTHADLSSQPWWRMLFELNLTRIAVESQTRHATRLFRPPYLGSDALPAGTMHVVEQAGNLGYITVGESIDPEDWARPGVAKLEAGASKPTGGIVLLHDGGGDRSETVAALPGIIDYYQGHGFRFMTVSQALDLPRDEIMPPLAPLEQTLSTLAGVVFAFWSWFTHALVWFMFIIILASFARMVIVTGIALFQSRRRDYSKLPAQIPACSILVPAYNESAVIQSCLRSLLNTPYPRLEVLVVDDGSADNTIELAEAIAKTDPRLRVLRKPNGGKASALNFGINRARGHFIVAIDADTVFKPHTIGLLMRHFADPKVGAVSGNTKVVNRHKLLTKLQSLEYIIGFNLDRRMGDLFDCITVVPGAIGAFRRTALLDIGGFESDTLAEDTDLTLSIKEAGYKIVYDHEAIAYTEAPATIRDLKKQRYRWTYGTMQAVFKHRRSILNPRYGTLGLIGLPCLVFYQIIIPLFSPVFDLALLVGLLTHQYQLIVVSFIAYLALDTTTSVIALKLDHEPLRQFWVIIPQRFFYRQLMYYVISRSAVNVLKGTFVRWGKLKRAGVHLARGT